MIFTHDITIQLPDTDAYSILFFSNQFQFCQVVFQAYLASIGEPLPVDRASARYLAVVVHAESDYCHPVRLGDRLSIGYQITRLGTTSFTNAFSMRNQKAVEVGRSRVTYVVIDPITSAKMPIPAHLRHEMSRLLVPTTP